MSRQLEQLQEERTRKRHSALLIAVEYGLQGAVEHSGGEYLGFAYRHRGGEALLIIKAVFPAGRQVAFVGAEDLGGALVKATKLGQQDRLRWKADKWNSGE